MYQICKSFRNEENGRYHNPEFTMLEWYRVGFDHHDLMDEMDLLLQQILKSGTADRMTYQQAFIDVLGVCPLEDSMATLKQ
uniref:amino acid--tRNA ligase-related protein n=1 Tax=Streptomyces europaeiscabiei TaxID=146819 RepID=UPI0038F65A82